MLDDFYRYPDIGKHFGKIYRDRSSAYDQSVFYLMCLQTDFFEKLCGVLRRGDNRNKVSVMYDMISAGDGQFVFIFDGAEKNVAAVFFCDAGNGHPIQTKLGEHFEFKKFHTSLGEGVDLDRCRETQQPRYLPCGSKLRIDDHGNSKLFFNKSYFLAVNGIPDAGDGLAAACFLCDEAAEEIQFVRSGD